MIKESTAHVRPGTSALVRLVLALAAWRKRAAERRRARLGQRHTDRLSDHMWKDIGFSRGDPERHVAHWLYRG